MSKWDAAMVAYEIAQEAQDGYDRASWKPHYYAAERGGPAIPDHVEAEMERRVDVLCAAEDVLIATPAPDLSATIWKIEHAHKCLEGFDDWPDTWWAAVMYDLRRLAA